MLLSPVGVPLLNFTVYLQASAQGSPTRKDLAVPGISSAHSDAVTHESGSCTGAALYPVRASGHTDPVHTHTCVDGHPRSQSIFPESEMLQDGHVLDLTCRPPYLRPPRGGGRDASTHPPQPRGQEARPSEVLPEPGSNKRGGSSCCAGPPTHPLPLLCPRDRWGQPPAPQAWSFLPHFTPVRPCPALSVPPFLLQDPD